MTDEIRYLPLKRGKTKVALLRGDEELSWAQVVPMTMQCGQARLRMDGIGGVETPEKHRYKGYSRRVLEAAVEFMTAGDAVLSTLYGIPHFYPKYGFATLGPEYVLEPIRLDERNALPAGASVRSGAPGDLPALQRLYRQETTRAYGPLVRDDDWWTWGEMEKALQPDAGEIVVVERDGLVVGYAYRASSCWWMGHLKKHDPEGLRIGEAFAADHDSAGAVLAACRQWATSSGGTRLRLAIPGASRVGQAARFQNVHITEQYHDDAEFMGRSTGLLALLRALVPELEARWRPVSCSTPAYAITMVTDGERATLRADEDGIEVSSDRPGDVEVKLGPGAIARLVMGGFEPEVTLERIDVPASARAVLATLFPKHIPYIYPLDRF